LNPSVLEWRDIAKSHVRTTLIIILAPALDDLLCLLDVQKPVLIALGYIANDIPQIKEIDLNPIIVVDNRPLVADAFMVM
jgi:hypothetical protein